MRRLPLSAPLAVFGVFAVILVLYSLALTADNEPLSPSEVKRILEAPSKYSYAASGNTQSLYRGESLTSDIKLFHEKPDRYRIEYLTPPLKGVVVGNNGNQAWRSDPKLRATVAVEASACLKPESRLSLFLDNHRIERAGSDRVANRQACILVVKSKSGKIRKRLWVDEKTYVVLRSEDYDAKGALLSATGFTSIKYTDHLPDSLYERPTGVERIVCLSDTGKPMSRNDLSKAVGFEVRLPSYIPAGYKLDAYRMYECPCGCNHKSAYVRYTNGLDSISIFETLADSDCMSEHRCASHRSRGGRCFVQGQMAVASDSEEAFIVIADIGPGQLGRIANSLR